MLTWSDFIRIVAITIGLSVVAVCVLMNSIHKSNSRELYPGQYDSEDQKMVEQLAISRWFQSLMQPDNPRISCCGNADAYEADDFDIVSDPPTGETRYVAVITGHRYATAIPIGTHIPVPNAKMKFDKGNPTGHGIIFIGSQGQVFCYITPAGG